MKRIKFTETVLFESEGRNKGPTYKEGSTHDFADDFADRWLRRGVAIEVNTREPLPEDEPKPETVAGIDPPKPEPAKVEPAKPVNAAPAKK